MHFLKVDNISITYGERVLLDGVNLTVSKGDKIALIARNGSGKTTLLKVILGLERPEGEQGTVRQAKGITVGYLEQEPQLNPDHNVLEAVLRSDVPALNAIRRYELAVLREDQDEIQAAIVDVDDHKAWGIESRVKEILTRLNITRWDQKVGSLSGGEHKRIALTKLLIEAPDFVVMDEPTNHLDVHMITWLEEYFSSAATTLLVVTHDRYFIEAVCNQVVELDAGKLYTYSGSYSQHLEKKAERLEQAERSHQKLRQHYKSELEWVRRQPKARGTKAKSRITDFKDTEKELHAHQTQSDLQIGLAGARLGKKIMEIQGLRKAYGERVLIHGFTYTFLRGDRIGVAGANGAGKSTLLQLLTKQIEADAGSVVHGDTVRFGHYTQKGLQLKEDKRVVDVVRDIADHIELSDGSVVTAEKMLENFLFPGPQQYVYVSQLSGGERKRLYLLTVLMGNPNFLILDEPTNDLDIDTLNILESYLFNFPGCLMIVSHDRYFMDRLVEHMFILNGDGLVQDFNGNYTDYLAHRSQLESAPAKPAKAPGKSTSSSSRELHNMRKELKKLERSLEKLTDEKAQAQAKVMDVSASADELMAAQANLDDLQSRIDEAEMRWLELDEALNH